MSLMAQCKEFPVPRTIIRQFDIGTCIGRHHYGTDIPCLTIFHMPSLEMYNESVVMFNFWNWADVSYFR